MVALETPDEDRRVSACIVRTCVLCCLLLPLMLSRLVAAEQVQVPGAISTTLTCREYPGALHSEVVRFEKQTAPFAKEPDLGQRAVLRGFLGLGGTNQHLPFIWDREQQRLYLDLNRNRDLTDDAGGRFTNEGSGTMPRGWWHHRFQNVRLKIDLAASEPAGLFDLEFFEYGGQQTQITLHSRSLWEGKLSVGDAEWQAGLLPVHTAGAKSIENGYLLLRPWNEREQPISANDNSLRCVSWPKVLFFQGKGYKLQPTFVPDANSPSYKLDWAAQAMELGTLNVTGKFLDRLVLYGSPATVLLCNPGPSVAVPVGLYDRYQLTLKKGDVEAFLTRPASSDRIEVHAQKPATLAAGGPLTNTVAAIRNGQFLNLSYQLTGEAGWAYSLTGARKEPAFMVFRGDKKIADGKFAFG